MSSRRGFSISTLHSQFPVPGLFHSNGTATLEYFVNRRDVPQEAKLARVAARCHPIDGWIE